MIKIKLIFLCSKCNRNAIEVAIKCVIKTAINIYTYIYLYIYTKNDYRL